MSFTTLLVGNGLGRAINNDFFDLQNAIKTLWNSNDEFLNKAAKKSILQCLAYTGSKVKIPSSENDLLMLQEAVTACQTL